MPEHFLQNAPIQIAQPLERTQDRPMLALGFTSSQT